MNAMGQLGHAVLVHEREHGCLEGGQGGLELEHHTRFAALSRLLTAHLFLSIGVAQHHQGRAVGPSRGLDHVGNEPLVGLRIEVLELLPRVLLVVRQIEVGPVVNALEFLPAEREFILDVVGVRGIVRELILAVLMPAQLLWPNPESFHPLHPFRAPGLEPFVLGAGFHEKLHLHLFELASPKDEVAGRDLVAERLADLRNSKGDLLARGLLHVQVIDIDPLRRLGPQVDNGGLILDRPHERLEHQIELPRRGERAFAAAHGALGVRLAGCALDLGIVGPKAVLALLAIHERIGEPGQMPRCLPDLGMHQDRGVEALDVVAFMHHRPPPALLDVLLELDAERSVIPHGAKAAIDLGGLKYEAAPFCQRHELLHRFVCSCGRHKGRKLQTQRLTRDLLGHLGKRRGVQ